MAENEKKELAAPSSEKTSSPEKAPKAKKDKKSEKSSKPGLFARIGKWLKEMKSELKKVQWPTRSQTINNTLIVIACVVIVGVFIWAFDYLAGSLIQLIISLFQGG